MYMNCLPHLPRMIETPQSDQIESVGHDGSSLFVNFRNGGTYRYDGVPEYMCRDLQINPSPGSYLASNVKGSYPYMRI